MSNQTFLPQGDITQVCELKHAMKLNLQNGFEEVSQGALMMIIIMICYEKKGGGFYPYHQAVLCTAPPYVHSISGPE